MSLRHVVRGSVLVIAALVSGAAPAHAQSADPGAAVAAPVAPTTPVPAPAAAPPPAPAAATAAVPDTSHDNVPARVKVLELTARAAPSADAPVLRVLPSGTLLNVSPGQKDGWRRTRLPDGQLGYVAGAGLELGPSPPSVSTAPVQPLAARPQPQIYIKNLDHLASLVAQDPVVSPMVQSLITRREGAWAIGIGGSVVGVILTSVGFLDTTKNCGSYAYSVCTTNFNTPLVITGLGVTLLSDIIMAAVYPKRDDYLDVINTWNTRHVDSQITIETVHVGAGI
ncbi:MAG TPA: SH3 domain-containing protein [Polyangia bacterium]|nr:SH3 domain-containing protein [Polyangia bacterium]